jgi:dTDP-4-amino-4,6-dideoxygalactose transaminase
MGMIKLPTSAIHKFERNYQEIFQSGNLAEGKWNSTLSNLFTSYTGARAAIPFSSNGAGLLAILSVLKYYRGFNAVFIQSNTMYGVKTIAITSGLNYVGAVPCSIPSLMPTASQVLEFIRTLSAPAKTVFIISHIGGIVNPDIDEISSICNHYGVSLIEDCAHSVGSTINGRHTGLFGTAGVYSLYATKAVAAGEGGIAITNDDDLGERLRRFQIYDRFDQKQDIGVNFRISELQALLSVCVCELIEDIISNKNIIAARYIHACNAAGLKFVDPYQDGQRGNHYKFTLIADNDVGQEFANIRSRTSPVYDYCLGADPMQIVRRHICLPIWYGLEEDIVDTTVSQIYRTKG